MPAVDEPEGFLRSCFCIFPVEPVEDKRFKNKKYKAEDQPYKNHCVKPPISQFQEAVPPIKYIEHIEPAKAGEDSGDLGLQGKTTFDPFKGFCPFFGRFHSLYSGNNNACYHRNAANPQYDAKNVHNTCNSKVYHN